MSEGIWGLFVAAAFAPVIVWLLWRLQAVSVDRVLRGGMFRLLRNHRALYNSVSWCGVLLHEVSHAVFLLLGGHGIRGFKVGVDSGHVTPRQVRKGPFGLFTFIVAALAPLFAAPAAILLLLALLVRQDLLEVAVAGPGLEPALEALGAMAAGFVQNLVLGLLSLDLATWPGLLVFLLAVLATPSARPSHIKNDGGQDEGDVAVVRSKIRRQPWPFVVFLLVLYGLYFALVPFWPHVYWTGFQWVWATAITATVLALAGGIGWWIVAQTGRTTPLLAWIPWTLALILQVLPRLVEVPGLSSPLWINAASAAAFAAPAVLLPLVAPPRGERALRAL